MATTYLQTLQAPLGNGYSPQIRRVLKPPERPIALRREYITEAKSLLTFRPQGDPKSAIGYSIQDDDGIVLFTASGRKFNDRPCREFRDASGLPLFEIHRKSFRNSWSVALPGSSRAKIATVSPRRSSGMSGWGNFYITFENAAAFELKDKDEKELTLEVQSRGNVLALYDIVDGDRKIAEVRESIQHNEKLALMKRFPSSKHGYRPVLDIIITAHVDQSLVAAVAVIISDTVFSANV
ncbi:tubby C-terminal-like domain-containing protein [Aspergillus coremiiformis]|uniref:Tubby C-terminal-like domain-containing protein n=1 Tax=Aspergillus coremiiformis TaxID=138285 RepID=A0A5N6Z3S7_9EURO|nr:tubby C-terminal-like domain-containing protein [Aspergillus coremiiformis]